MGKGFDGSTAMVLPGEIPEEEQLDDKMPPERYIAMKERTPSVAGSQPQKTQSVIMFVARCSGWWCENAAPSNVW